ncbi:MAG: MBL fold metallo-hydrolase [Anaerolineae bacterium]|nr:MBL fold metallo-hydrolase [Anaerolineae bacterium]MBN8618881.1 MBL fold metallo-hydrolase [Anaerolineae bacterium]
MDINWYGHSCFRITERNRVTVVTDPFSETIGLPVPRLKGDVVTISHDEPGHNNTEVVKGASHIFTGPGEYEVGGVFITGIELHQIEGQLARWNIAFRFEYDNLTVLHLGDLAHIPDQSTIEKFGEVNVLLLPVGGGMGLHASQAAEVVGLIEPSYVIPMHYGMPGLALDLEPVDKFLKAMGITTVSETDVFKVSGSEFPEQTQVVMLKPQLQPQT